MKVQYVEGGSAVVADRVVEEKSKPQADILVTLLEQIARPSADPVPRPAVGVVPAPTGAYRRRVPAPATREGGEGSWSGTAGPAGPAGGTARS